MKQKIVIYESPQNTDWPLMTWDLSRGRKVYVVEPVFAFHYRSRSHFYPRHLPGFVKDLVASGKAQLLTTDQLKSKEIFFEAGDKAVKHVERVFKELHKNHAALIQYVCDTLRSQQGENAFKTNLAHRLSEFFSMNILLQRIAAVLGTECFTFHPRMNIRFYRHVQKLVEQSGVGIFSHRKINVPYWYSWIGNRENLKAKIIIVSKIFIQAVGAIFFPQRGESLEKGPEQYFLGFAIVAPRRQLVGNKRSPDFLADQEKIRSQDIVYFVQNELTAAQQKHLDKLGKNYALPRMGRFFSHPSIWTRLFSQCWKKHFLSDAEELETALLVLFRYFAWQTIQRKVRVKHFVTHCDFGVPHIGRNIALNQNGTQTWYFTDSMNFSGTWREESNQKSHRHPWWTYLTYDHMVTWAQFIVDYFQGHPMSIGRYHIIGCLWSSLSNGASLTRDSAGVSLIIGVFDTGYNFNGIGCYQEGIAFTRDILRLADEFSDIQILFKSKFTRPALLNADPVFGPQLTGLYDSMERHPRIKMLSCQKDPSEVIPLSDFVISFPFTSTTFEALSSNKLAIWHDPFGLYHETMYGRLPGVVTYGYEELKARVKELKNDPAKLKEIPIPAGSPLLDPYRDEKALERFRGLLINPSFAMEIESKEFRTGHMNTSIAGV